MPHHIKFITVACLVFFCFSCNSGYNQKELIRGRKNKYWDKPYKNTSTGLYGGAYRLGKDGSAYWVKYNRQTGKRNYARADDQVGLNTWELLPNDTLRIERQKYKILLLNDDTMVLYNINSSLIDTLIKSIDQTDNHSFPPKKEDTTIL